jgi:hypothetical protein
MKKQFASLLTLSLVVALVVSSCKKDEVVVTPTVVKLSFAKDVKAIFTNNCGPCHLAGGTNPNKWENYAEAKAKIATILDRTGRATGTAGAMPKGGTQLPAATLAVLKQWMDDGLLE